MSGLALLEPGADPLIGKTLAERYQVVRKLGEGGMGAVYEGEHLVIKKRVAIKVLHPQWASAPEVVARFHQEALAATSIGHEHIVEVNDMGRTPDGALFMVLEYLKGRDFADLLEKESPLPIGRIAHICAQVSDAVQAAHDKGIVHRDLKPENVYLVKRGGDPDFVKVLDFGISKMRDAEGSSRAQTKTGAVMGTAYYMSPEQAMGKRDVDHRSDVWAMGVILFKALTGRYPFDHEAYPMLIVKICSEPPPSPSSLRSDIPPELEKLIGRCLDKDPAARPQSCAELVTALGPFRGLMAVLPGTRMSAAAPAPMHVPSSGVRAAGSTGSETGPAAFAATMATPGEGNAAPGAGGSSAATSAGSAARSAAASPETMAEAGLPRSSGGSRWQIAAGVTVLATLLAGGGAWIASQPSEPAIPVAPVVEPPVPTPDPPAEPAAATGDPAPSAGSIALILSPIDAIALIDSRPVLPDAAGDFHVPVAPDDTTIHELRVEARGFRSRVEDLRLSYPQRIVLSLDPGSGEDDRRARGTGASGGSGGHGLRGHAGGTASSGGTATGPGATTPTADPTPAATAGSSGGASTTPATDPPPASGGGSSGGGSSGGAEPEHEDGVVAPPPRMGLKRLPTTPT